MEKDLISVIIPIYNAEKYISKMMKALSKQTYSNIEIILVDDGSKDSSFQICEKYASELSRVQAFRKENGGAASARNYGFRKSKGKYITFVDADDWITEDYIEFLYDLMVDNEADISICGYKKCFQYPVIFENKHNPVRIFTAEEALENLLYRRNLTNSPCLKLLKREMFEEFMFPEGMLYEDLAVVYQWLGASRRIVYSPDVKYYYFQRQGSSMHSSFNRKKWDLIRISEIIRKYICQKYPMLEAGANSRLFISSLQMVREVPLGKKYKPYRIKLRKNIRWLRLEIFLDKRTDKKTKVLAIASYLPYPVLKFMGMFSAKMVMKLKIIQRY